MKYDYLIAGAGLFGAVFAGEAALHGKKCLVIDKRNHIAGNIYTEEIKGIRVHKYGPYFSYVRQKNLGLCKPVCRVQPLYQFAGGCLQG